MDFTATPNEGPRVVATAAEDWNTPDSGLMTLAFYKRHGSTVAEYVRIEHVPNEYPGRAITLWILAHPWRLASSVRMVSAFVSMRLRKRRYVHA